MAADSPMIHLISRFFGFLGARPLRPTEQAQVASILSPSLCRLFYRQCFQDQRHAFEVARRVANRPELQEAALVHDIGKSSVSLGALGRSCATLWGSTSLPVWGQWRTYLEHASQGAELLERHGAGYSSIAFTRHHPGPPPEGFDPAGWAALTHADES